MKPEKKNEELKIRISGLSNGLHDYRFSADPSAIGLENNFNKPVEVDAHLDKTSRQLYLTVDIRTSAHFECDRSLDEFEQPLTAHFNMFFVYDELEADKYPPDEVHVIAPDTVSLDLTKDIREMVLLSVPLKLLCRENCKGLCPQCGTNWNHESCDCKEEVSDPRWSGLKDLLDK
ncbi:MAG: DUF177 domain-containing protein [Ignavibacteria bacterium]|nr:DUF177 domain-containing protein [Ignavibacteria bacterium]MBI3765250.1 DUF177 domain-containing protein [Ignavibacteriales bacterium]